MARGNVDDEPGVVVGTLTEEILCPPCGLEDPVIINLPFFMGVDVPYARELLTSSARIACSIFLEVFPQGLSICGIRDLTMLI